ncbi:MAG: ATP-binding protein [Candidatus Caenarcaniphilales bacterium]|nr:ATP-binding protein [Candidatus Caenarcaniphilales bacterium]
MSVSTSKSKADKLSTDFAKFKNSAIKQEGNKSETKPTESKIKASAEDIKNLNSPEKMSFDALEPNIQEQSQASPSEKKFVDKFLKVWNSRPAGIAKSIVNFTWINSVFDFFNSKLTNAEKIQNAIVYLAISVAPQFADKAIIPLLEKMLPKDKKSESSFNPDTDMVFPNPEFKKTLYNGIARFLEATDTSGVSLNLDKRKKKAPAILFTGPPGVGKTEIAKFVARKAGKELMFVSAAELSSFIGGSEKNIIKAFENARQNNGLLFFDEADTFVSKRIDGAVSGSAKHDNNVVNTILKQLDESGVMCIFATNSGEVDPAFKDRMRSIVAFQPATPEQNFAIVLNLLHKMEMKPDHLQDFIDEQTRVFKALAESYMSPRDMHSVIDEAVELVSQRVSSAKMHSVTLPERETSITVNDFMDALNTIKENKEGSERSNMAAKVSLSF